jgi:hypothetical protein
MRRAFFLTAMVAPLALTSDLAAAQGTKPVTTGKVIRGLTLPPPPGAPGTSTGTTCDFSGDPVDQNGRLTGSSVNCKPDGTLPQTLAGLPARFNAYCVIDAPRPTPYSLSACASSACSRGLGADRRRCIMRALLVAHARPGQKFLSRRWPVV